MSAFEESISLLPFCDLTRDVPRSKEEFFQRTPSQVSLAKDWTWTVKMARGASLQGLLDLVVRDMLEMTGITWVSLESQKALPLTEST